MNHFVISGKLVHKKILICHLRLKIPLWFKVDSSGLIIVIKFEACSVE